MKAIEAGIDNIDTSISSLSLTYGHSPTETLAAIFKDQTAYIDQNNEALEEAAVYFKKIRKDYSEFEGDMKGVDSTMLIKQVPGGMLSNLESQLKANHQEDKIEMVKEEIPKVREDFGFPPLVTPASQIIGAQALLNVMGNVRYENLSNESKNLLLGKYGDLPGEVNIDLYNKAKETSTELETGQEVEDEMIHMKAELKKLCLENNLDDLSENLEMLLTYVLFPNIALKFFKSLNQKKTPLF